MISQSRDIQGLLSGITGKLRRNIDRLQADIEGSLAEERREQAAYDALRQKRNTLAAQRLERNFDRALLGLRRIMAFGQSADAQTIMRLASDLRSTQCQHVRQANELHHVGELIFFESHYVFPNDDVHEGDHGAYLILEGDHLVFHVEGGVYGFWSPEQYSLLIDYDATDAEIRTELVGRQTEWLGSQEYQIICSNTLRLSASRPLEKTPGQDFEAAPLLGRVLIDCARADRFEAYCRRALENFQIS